MVKRKREDGSEYERLLKEKRQIDQKLESLEKDRDELGAGDFSDDDSEQHNSAHEDLSTDQSDGEELDLIGFEDSKSIVAPAKTHATESTAKGPEKDDSAQPAKPLSARLRAFLGEAPNASKAEKVEILPALIEQFQIFPKVFAEEQFGFEKTIRAPEKLRIIRSPNLKVNRRTSECKYHCR
ncbi:hypothetical protein QAD02_013806 [Eretmocerus hayati]|uniref:Uncharacterized protein n=1 Tax=Eretmocerus hayati TaxID=131215 RepID=A0ACC2P632_9HYME|nr:hypothetical protein QAD02_013806 [Eretmocerus hayati]